MPVSIRNFVIMKYYASEELQQRFDCVEAFSKEFLNDGGITEWLESLSDADLSLELVNSIAKTFIVLCDRQPIAVPHILKMLIRQYRVNLPSVEGLMSQGYWQEEAIRCRWVKTSE